MKTLVALVLPIVGLIRRAYWFIARPKTVGAKIVLTHGGEMLLLRHTYEPDIYGLPGGGLGEGEDSAAGIRREVREELGIELVDPRYLGCVESDVEYKHDTVHVFAGELADRLTIRPDPIEIAELRWAAIDALPAVGPVTAEILRLYRKRHGVESAS